MTDYNTRLEQEKLRFNAEIDVHDLPDIFHYWSNKYLRPFINGFGYDSIDDFFVLEIARRVKPDGRPLRVASVGCGDCSTEIRIAKGLAALGLTNYRIVCMDISDAALARGLEYAKQAGLDDHFELQLHDFNQGLPDGEFDIVMANQSLHHVVELERLYESIRTQLAKNGCFLVSDMIGRNGHQRWPEAQVLVDEVWRWLPERYRYNWQLRRQEHEFMDWDCSQEGFEGVRAQDVLPLLLKYFAPREFLVWGNIIDVFIDRGLGHNFRTQTEWELHFIDQVHAVDAQAISEGRIKPTHLLGRFQNEPCECVHAPNLSPQKAVRVAR